jgi:serine/threonine protein phosphatase 1
MADALDCPAKRQSQRRGLRQKISGIETLRVRGRPPLIPAGRRVYAVGDIHGCSHLLGCLLDSLRSDLEAYPSPKPLFVFLGDYIDRGPQSRGTLDRLMDHAANFESIFIRGNHESMILGALFDRSKFEQWLHFGGIPTLLSYGMEPDFIENNKSKLAALQSAFQQIFPGEHYRFLRGMTDSFALGDYFFAHAGARPGVALASQRTSDLHWIREDFLSSTFDYGRIIVHGHTPVDSIDVRANRINIDTGAFATGRLTCLVIDHDGLAAIDTPA